MSTHVAKYNNNYREKHNPVQNASVRAVYEALTGVR